MSRFLALITTTCAASLLVGCSSLNSPSEHHQSVCATLKSQIIFGGGTSNTRRANIENAEQPLQLQSYDKNNC